MLFGDSVAPALPGAALRALADHHAATGESGKAADTYLDSKDAQEIEQVQLVLRAQDKSEAVLVEMHDIQKGLS
jgi:hypothetical protein